MSIKFVKGFVLFIFILGYSETAIAKKHHVEKLIQQYAQVHNFNGSILVSKGSDVVHKSSYGVSNVSTQIKNSSHTRFNLASVSKQFTAATIMLLVSEKRLSLDDTISHYLPYYRSDIGDKVTIHQLLNHTSGMKSFGKDKGFMQKEAGNEVTTKDFILKRCSNDLVHSPGSKFLYSNSGYYILGAIIEQVTKLNYGDAVQHYIFKPLGMINSGFEKEGDDKDYATGYHQFADKLTPASVVHRSVSFSSGGLYSSVEDLLKWNIALYSGDLLPKNLLKLMLSPNIENYGYGIRQHTIALNDGSLESFYGHGGSLFGFSSYLAYLPQTQYTIAVLSNSDMPSIGIAKKIIKVLLGMSVDLPASILNELLPLLQKGKIKTAMTLYDEQLKAGYKGLGPNTLIKAGKRLFNASDYVTAKTVFKFNEAIFPDHCQSAEWLGKTYLAQKNIQQAIFYFKQAADISSSCDDSIRFLSLVDKNSEKEIVKSNYLANQTLTDYIGRYQMSKNKTLSVLFDNDTLFAKPQGQKRVKLEPLKARLFDVVGTPAKLEFIQNKNGKIVSVRLIQHGKSRIGKKITDG